MSPSDINRERNESFRFFKQFSRETILIILVAICVIVTTGNHFRTDTAIDAADAANTTSTSTAGRLETELQRMALEFERELRRSDEQWSKEYTELKKEERLLQNKIDRYEAKLYANGDN